MGSTLVGLPPRHGSSAGPAPVPPWIVGDVRSVRLFLIGLTWPSSKFGTDAKTLRKFLQAPTGQKRPFV